MNEIHIELFRFNFKTDYLPYYRKFTLVYDANETMLDLFNKLNEKEAFTYTKESIFRVNGYCMGTQERVSDIVQKYSNEIKIDGASDFFAKDDLLLHTERYSEKLDIFDAYLSADEKRAYLDELTIAYFASNTLNYNKDYIGEHALLVAIELIKNRPELKKEILDLITDEHSGIWYHTSLEDRVHNFNYEDEKNIQNLILNCATHTKIDTSKFLGLEKMDAQGDARVGTISQDFNGFNIATYNGFGKSTIDSLVSETKASKIDLINNSVDMGAFALSVNDDFTYTIAGDILLEAKDANADFILVKNEKTKVFFDANQSKMQKLVGREINLPVISRGQFVQLLQGERDLGKLGFDSHNVKVSFL